MINMRKEFTLTLNEEELILLVGILRYSVGEVLTEVYSQLARNMTADQLLKAIAVAREIAITGNGYYINEEDLIYEVLTER